ncbi:uncharacterized protein LOC112126566 [Cimex lectularius]|uniref:Uncharacterized protein n=1 Tax=Cimex lectularius TaxID=79782 RepID=A0A8I6SGP3_CIMLE|nr:uncharacterized protein LOC112126566 [Cimex lectularius]
MTKWSCHNTKEKIEKFNDVLFRLMKKSKELCQNEKLQLYVTMKQTVNFTANGFFTLGYPLVTSVSVESNKRFSILFTHKDLFLILLLITLLLIVLIIHNDIESNQDKMLNLQK